MDMTTLSINPTTLIAVAAAADGATFLHFSQLIGGLQAVTKTVTEQTKPHPVNIWDLLRATPLGNTVDCAIKAIDDVLNKHFSDLEDLSRAQPVNLNDLKSSALLSVDQEINMVITQLLPKLSTFVPVGNTEKVILERRRAALILPTPDKGSVSASGRVIVRQAAAAITEITKDAPRNVLPFFEDLRKAVTNASRRTGPVSQLTFVKVTGDGSCFYRAIMLGAGFEVRQGRTDLPVIHYDSVRAMILGAIFLYRDTPSSPILGELFPNCDAISLLSTIDTEVNALTRPVLQTDSGTWATTMHVSVFGSAVRANVSNNYNTRVSGEPRSVTYPLTVCSQADVTIYVHIPSMKGNTHSDAWIPDALPADLSRRFFVAWTTLFRAIPHASDVQYDSFLLRRSGVDVNRVSLKLLSAMQTHPDFFPGADSAVRTLFIDEATMVHPGQIVYSTLAYPGLTKVIMVGDVNQIPFHDRLHVGVLQVPLSRLIASSLPELNVTYRCPQDVVYALREFYVNFHTHNDVVCSLSIQRSGSPPRVEGALYVTFTRAEKQTLTPFVSTVPGAKIYTVTEAQGLTFDHVVVVREQVNDIEIYRSRNQAITAISRHRQTVV